MEMQFQDTPLYYLRSLTCQHKSLEQTQEVRISDGMPDIGSVLGAWGQVLLRSKQWNTNALGLSAGVMVWILYAPEEDGPPTTMEVWVPFQEKFDLPDTGGREGTVHCSFHLADVDVRNTSARKLFVRVNVDIRAEALVQEKTAVYMPGELPEDIQLLKNTYPLQIPVESGEKPFELEESLMLPQSNPSMEKLVYYHAVPMVQEQKVLADKVIFRGTIYLHMLYMGQDQQLYTWDFQIPFSQFGELGQEYEPSAVVDVQMVMTSAELSKDEQGQLHINLGLVGQYTVSNRQLLTLVEDVYSVGRPVTGIKEQLELPVILDRQDESVTLSESISGEGMRLADVSFRCADVRVEQGNNRLEGVINGQFQALWYDMEGKLRGGFVRKEQTWSTPVDNGTKTKTRLTCQMPQGVVSGGNVDMEVRATICQTTYSGQGIPMITGLEVGEWLSPDPGRPSLILCRADQSDLWTIAKSNGATVEAIRKANHLEGEPTPGQFLLIPMR